MYIVMGQAGNVMHFCPLLLFALSRGMQMKWCVGVPAVKWSFAKLKFAGQMYMKWSIAGIDIGVMKYFSLIDALRNI